MIVTRIPCERLLMDTIAEAGGLILAFRFHVLNDVEYRAQIQIQPVTHLQQGRDGCGGWALVHIVNGLLGNVNPLAWQSSRIPLWRISFFSA